MPPSSAVVARFLAPLNPQDRARVMALAEPWQARVGEVVLRQGAAVPWLWMIDHGQVRFEVDSAAGRAVITGMAGEGHCFGEVEVIAGGVGAATAIAMVPCSGWKLAREQVSPLLDQVPAFTRLLLESTARGTKLLHQLYLHTLLLTPEQRLALVLINLSTLVAEGTTQHRVVNATQDMLTQFSSASRQFVSRHLSAWADQGWIATRYRRIEIVSLDGLKSLFDDDLPPMMLSLLEHR